MLAFDQPIVATNPVNHQHAVAALVNQQRARRGLRPVRPSPLLRLSARRWALMLTRLSRFEHGNLDRRARAFPFVVRGRPGEWSVGENLAWGLDRYSTPRSIVQAWMRSQSHRATLLGAWRYTAVVSMRDAPMPGHQTSGVTVVQHFGR